MKYYIMQLRRIFINLIVNITLRYVNFAANVKI